jgi:hypothetical protein
MGAIVPRWRNCSIPATWPTTPPTRSPAAPSSPPSCATFPDLRFSVEEQIAEGDRVMTRWRARGSHRRQFCGLPATGKRIAITGITLSRFVAGRVVEEWRNWDTLGLIEQLGIGPGSAPGGDGGTGR